MNRPATARNRSFAARAGGAASAGWGAITGVAPHVLHHVGPPAGAAVLAGAGGRLVFGAIMLAVSAPFLLRLYRRFATWVAPAMALVVMAAMFTVSSFVIGPAIGGESGSEPPPSNDHQLHKQHQQHQPSSPQAP